MGGPNLKLHVKLDNETKKSHGLREGFYIACNHVHNDVKREKNSGLRSWL